MINPDQTTNEPNDTTQEDGAPAQTLNQEIEQKLYSEDDSKRKNEKRKKRLKLMMTLAGILLILYAVYWLFKPSKGGIAFGICKVFVELNVQYPNALRYSSVQNFGASLRIWYIQKDGFGQNRMEAIQCYFEPDDVYGMRLERVTIDRREIDPNIVEKFNLGIPAIIAYPPDLTYPQNFPDIFDTLHFQTDLFRKPLL